MDKLRVAILDDHPLLRNGLKDVILLHPQSLVYDAVAFGSSSELWQYLQDHTIDILFLDLELDGESGIDIYNRIADNPSLSFRTIVFSSHVQPRVIKSLYSGNIFAYLSKNEDNLIIWESISEYAKERSQYYSPAIQKILISSAIGIKKRSEFIPVLTKREKEILRLIMEEKSSAEIARILYLSEHTIESHRANLFSKMQVRNVAGLVKKTIEFGLLDND